MFSGEAINTNFMLFGLTRSGLKSMIYHTRDEHANVVDHGFIGGVMVSMHVSSVVDHGFIGGVMVSMHVSSVRGCCLG
jgi:hypothetical protein